MSSRLHGAALAAALSVAAWCAACGGSSSKQALDNGPDGGTGRDASADSTVATFSDAAESLTIQPQNMVLQVTAPGATVQFTAMLGSAPAEGVTWSITSGPAVGVLDPMSGLFTASGAVGGTVNVVAQMGTLQGQTQLTVVLGLQDNQGNLTMAQQQQLLAGADGGADAGGADPAFRWLYPYDQTVFPRGLLPPTLQFAGILPDAVYVHVSFGSLDYKGFFGPSSPGQVTFTPAIWAADTLSAAATDDVQVQITKLSGGQVSGPITETWFIAQGTLKGTVYYESRDAFNGGATMRIRPGAPQADVLLGDCTVCHYVSANGSTIVAYANPASGPAFSASYDLTKNAAVIYQEQSEKFAFGALSADGSLLMSMASPGVPAQVANPASGPNNWVPNVPGFSGGPYPALLYDPKTGAHITAPTWENAVQYALMTTFSPDGKLIAFNHYDTGMGHTLGMMNLDATQSPPLFSGLLDFAMDPQHYLGWPTFTPDDEWVVYATDTNGDYGTWGQCMPSSYCTSPVTSLPSAKGDLGIAHLGSKTTASLDNLNGVMNGQYYLPFGETAEGHMNYLPTILPVAVGGYYWVVFTSRREYGNTINTADPYYTDGAGAAGTPEMPEEPWRKKLWVAALDIDTPEHPSLSAHDISHPAFYLPGQDLLPGNYRGFWALDPCQQAGVSCSSGDECCTGFCRPGTATTDGGLDAGPASDAGPGTGFVCVPPQGCANEYEKCATAADCCQAGSLCINGFCAQPAQ
jgi:hypothetical protein